MQAAASGASGATSSAGGAASASAQAASSAGGATSASAQAAPSASSAASAAASAQLDWLDDNDSDATDLELEKASRHGPTV